jgi:hypothetical protein
MRIRQLTIRRSVVALCALLMTIGGVASAAPASAQEFFDYRLPANVLSRQFVNGNCVYKVAYGNFGSVPYAKVMLFGGTCDAPHMPRPRVEVIWNSPTGGGSSSAGGSSTVGVFGGQEACGPFIGIQALGPPGETAARMYVYFPRTTDGVTFRPNAAAPNTPRGPFC